MIKVTKKINLAQLDQELNGLGLVADLDENKKIIFVGLAENNNATEEQLQAAIDAHIAVDENETREAQRQAILDRLGITSEEAKILLGA